MKRLRAPVRLLVALLLILAACGVDKPAPTTTAPVSTTTTLAPPESLPIPRFVRSSAYHEARASAAAGETPSEAYVLEHKTGQWAHQLGIVWGGLWYGSQDIKSVDTTTWPDNHHATVWYTCGAKMFVHFDGLHYDPELSNITYGSTKIAQELPAQLGGHAYLYDLTNSSEPGHFSQSDSVTLEQSRSTTITNGMNFNASVSSQTKISGGFAGAKMEETVTATMGLDLKSETQKAEAESTARTQQHAFDVALPPFQATLIDLESTQVHSSTPFDIDGVPDWKTTITLNEPCGKSYPSAEAEAAWQYGQGWVWHHGNLDATKCWGNPPKSGYPELFRIKACQISFDSIDRLAQALAGVHERWPGMATENQSGWPNDYTGWIDEAGNEASKHAYYGPLRHPDDRRIRLTGIQTRVYEDAVRQTVTNVTGQDLDKVLADSSATSCDTTSETCG